MTVTLARPVSVAGRGLHSGALCAVTLEPARSGGIQFAFGDVVFPLEEAQASGDGRGTRLTFPGGASVSTVEHLLAACSGLSLWHVLVRVEGPEIPAADGSAALFAAALMEGGLIPADPVVPWGVPYPVTVEHPARGSVALALPSETWSVSYVLSYPSPHVGTQIYDGFWPEAFLKDLAGARTFALLEEVEGLRARGLAQGGGLDNAVVVAPEGVLNPEGWRFPGEAVRHKVLDLMGDLALFGCPLVGRFFVCRGGHALHLELLRRLRNLAARRR